MSSLLDKLGDKGSRPAPPPALNNDARLNGFVLFFGLVSVMLPRPPRPDAVWKAGIS